MTTHNLKKKVPLPSADFPVSAFGAVGDGVANDTASVQRALDACHAAGGGRVVLDPGVYVCGTLDLKSHTELFLAAGAVLLGSPRREDYRTDGNAPYDKNRAHFIRAVGAVHIAIRGAGIIDGNGKAYFGSPDENSSLRRFRLVTDWRPSHMLAFCECIDVVIEGVQLLNSTTYTIWPFACERVRIQGVTIRNPPETPNGDGIDPTACRDVLISQCFIDTGDDCIALYSGPANGVFGAEARPCENIVITDCVLRSVCTAVRLGPHGDGPIRHCVISDLVISAGVGISMHVFALGGKFTGTVYESVHGPQIEDIQVRNVSIRARLSPLFMQIYPDSREPAGIRDISLSGVHMESPGAVCVVGCEQIPVERLVLNDITMHASKPTVEFSARVPDPVGKLSSKVCLGIPHAFYLRHVRNRCLRQLRVYGTGAGTGRTNLAVSKKKLQPPVLRRLENRFLEVLILPEVGGRIVQVVDRKRDRPLIPGGENPFDFESVGYEEYAGSGYHDPGYLECYAVDGQSRAATQPWILLKADLPGGLRIERRLALRENELHIHSVLTNGSDRAIRGALRPHARWRCDPLRDKVSYTTQDGAQPSELLAAFTNREVTCLAGTGMVFHLTSLGVRLDHEFSVAGIEKAGLLAYGQGQEGSMVYDLFARPQHLKPQASLSLDQVYRVSDGS